MTDRVDTFNRADGAIGTPSDAGSAWVEQTGTWHVLDNTAYCPSGSQATCVLESSVADAVVQVTFSTVVSTTDSGLVVRAIDANNYILFAMYGSAGGGWRIYEVVAGSFTALGGAESGSLSSGDIGSFECNGTSLIGKVNGATVISRTSSTHASATKHGIRSHTDANTRLDAFSITGIGGGGGSVVGAARSYLSQL